MNIYNIDCSLGEIIDKLSILQIKLLKVNNNSSKYNNIKKEYDLLLKYNEGKVLNDYFNKLYNINKILWDLEDEIRLKSSLKEFDERYINIAELIHITNDKRCKVKRNINIEYNSNIIEEKLYNSNIIEELNETTINEDKCINLINNKINEDKIIQSESTNPIDILNIYFKNNFYKDIKINKYKLNKISKKDKKIIKNAMLNKGKLTIERKLKNLILKNEHWFLPNYYLAKHYIILNQYDNAHIFFKKAIEINNTNVNVNLEYARFLNQTIKNVNIIIKQWLYCIRINNKMDEPYINIINIILNDNKSLENHDNTYINFLKIINIGLKHNPDNIILLNGLARYYEKMKDYNNCLDYHFKCLKIQPNNPKILYNTGLTIMKSTKKNDAIDYFIKALKYDDNLEYIHKDIIIYYNINSNYNKSLEYSLKAYNKFKTNFFLSKVCSAYLELFELDKAEKIALILLKSKEDKKILQNYYLILAKINKYKRDFIKGDYYYNYLIKNLYILNINSEKIQNIKTSYAFYLFRINEYKKGYNYINYINRGDLLIENIKIPEKKISFISKTDINKTLMIFNCGFGDTIMYGRYIDHISKQYPENKFIYVINSKLKYLYNYSNFIENKNVKILIEKEAKENYDKNINYYCDGSMLNKYLNLDSSSIYFNPYFSKIPDNNFSKLLSLPKDKKIITINWHGNRNNSMEKYRRGIDLELLIPLFKLPNIKWISIQKDITTEEKDILKENNVIDTSEYIDNNENAYVDTISIFYASDLVISTDTSILHLGATMNINIWGLIAYYCEWRWGLEKESVWYPHLKLYRQDKTITWNNVINKLTNDLTDNLENSCISPKEIQLIDNYDKYNYEIEEKHLELIKLNNKPKIITTNKHSIFYSYIDNNNEIIGFYREKYNNNFIGLCKFNINTFENTYMDYKFMGEDPRSFYHNNKLYIVDNTLNKTKLINIDLETYNPIYYPVSILGKNITFFSYKNILYAIKWFMPLIIYKCENLEENKWIVIYNKEFNNESDINNEYRGGTPGYIHNNIIYGLGHKTIIKDKVIHIPFIWKLNIDNYNLVIQNITSDHFINNIIDPTSILKIDNNYFMISAESMEPWFQDQNYITKIYNITNELKKYIFHS